MKWEYKAKQLRNTSSLGRRQAQVAVLTEHGHTPKEIVRLINEHEDDAPEPETIQSIQSKLYRQLLDASVTQHALTNGLHSVRPPVQLRNEHETTGSAVHAYIGGIGMGCTVTAQSHALRLTQHLVDDFIVLDFIDEWRHMEDELPGMDRITFGNDLEIDDYDFLHNTDVLLDTVRSREPDTHTVVFITQAHYVFADRPSLIEDIKDATDNVSIRLVTQTVEEFPDDVEPDMYHFHGTQHESTRNKIKEIQENTVYEPSVDVSELPYHFPSPVHNTDPAYMVTAIPETGETLVRSNVLTEHENDILVE